MRKTKKCAASKVDTLAGRMVMRTCDLSRGHDSPRHHDGYGAWTVQQPAEQEARRG